VVQVIDPEGTLKTIERTTQTERAVLSGMKNAAKAWKRLSGSPDLMAAPEYFVTCHIADCIWSAGGRKKRVEVEVGISKTLSSLGIPHQDLGGKKFDIVIYENTRSSGKYAFVPARVIEVKHGIQIGVRKGFKEDFRRISWFLQEGASAGGRRYGLVAFTAYATGKSRAETKAEAKAAAEKQALKILDSNWKTLISNVGEYAKEAKCRVKLKGLAKPMVYESRNHANDLVEVVAWRPCCAKVTLCRSERCG
jgi:hypothetical protein